jgi:RHS repeat-associated protein
MDDDDPNNLHAYIMNRTGVEVKPEFTIPTEGIGAPKRPELAYNPTDNTYMLLWSEPTGTYIDNWGLIQEYHHLYALQLSSSGIPLAPSATLITDQLTIWDIRMAYDLVYNSTADEYLVVWEKPPGAVRWSVYQPHTLFAQRMSAEGTLQDSPVAVFSGVVSSIQAAYSTVSDEYIVTWDLQAYDPYGYEIYAQRLEPSDLSPRGGYIHLTNLAHGWQANTRIAYAETTDQYIVTFDDTYPEIPGPYIPDLRGRSIKAGTGTLIGWVTILESEDPVGQGDVEYIPTTDQFLVIGLPSTNHLTIRYLTSAGEIDSPPGLITELFGISPRLAARTSEDGEFYKWLVTWNTDGDIYAQIPIKYVVSEDACLVSIDECMTETMTQNYEEGPINTRTGAYDYSVEDISIQTSTGPLSFRRTYASFGTDLYTEPLGHGWTHNQASRLYFPGDPEGKEGVILFKASTSNRYEFIDNGDGTYTTAPGVCGELTLDAGPPIRYTVTDNAQNTYVFDENGVLLTRSDSEGHTWTYSYWPEGWLEQITDDTGLRYLFFEYDAQGRLEYIEDHTFRTVGFTYDPNGDLVSSMDLLGEFWSYTYDVDHNLTEVIDPRGITVERTEFETEGRAVRQYNGEDELLVEITYNPDGTSTITDGLGNVSTDVYDYRKTYTDAADALGGTTSKEYDVNFRPKTLTDEAGATTELTWSDEGANLTQVVDAEGNLTDLAYDELNNITDVVDPRGYLTTYTYDGTQLTSAIDALNNTTTYIYTPEGYLESVTDARGHTPSYTYDSYGQRTSMTDALGNTWTYTYDDLGRLIDATDPLERVTHNEYDNAGRLIKVTRNYNPSYPQNDDGEVNIVTEYVYDEAGNQIEVIDTYGNITQYIYDDSNRLIQTIDPLSNTTTNTYDLAGNLASTADALGRTTTYVYDELNRLVETIDPLGDSMATGYNPDGTVASTTDALGQTTSYTYDDLKRVVATTDPLGNSTATVYDEAGNVVSTTDAEGRATTFAYDALGRLILQTDPLGGETEHFYDSVGNRVQTIDPRNHATTYTYDELNRLETVTDALGNTTAYAYDEVGNRASVTDANDNATYYFYDGLDRLTSERDPLYHWRFTYYDALGNIIDRWDPNGNLTTYEYDELNRLVRQVDGLGGETAYTYDDVGNQTSVMDAEDNTTTTAYDALNRPETVTDALGHSSTTAYNAVGNVVYITDALGNTTTFAYDDLNRQIGVTDPLGNTTSYAYDDVGNRIAMTDANGIETRYEYDYLNRLTAVVENYVSGTGSDNETNVRTEYTYDAVGNRLAILDGNSHVMTFTYDVVNRLGRETDALNHEWVYAYDGVGNRTSLTDALGNTTIYNYDDANRLTGIIYPPPDSAVSFSYDWAGNRVAMSDAVGTTTWTYDELNRVVAVNDPFGDTVGYGYDAVGNRISLSYPEGKAVSYTYDAANRMTEVLDWDSQTTSYAYSAVNQLLTTSLPNGVASSYTYDDAGQVLNITHTTTTDTLSSFSYTYDQVGNRTQAVEYYKTPGGGPTVTVAVTDEYGSPLPDLPVYVFDGETYTNFNEITDLNGEVSITLPEGEYRFRVDVDGAQYWSGETNHCAIPGCNSVLMTIPDEVYILVQDTDWNQHADVPVYAFDESTYTGFNGTTDDYGYLPLQLPEGNYRFRADYNDTQFWSGDVNHCPVPGCNFLILKVTVPVTVNVEDSMGMPQEGIPVYVFDGSSYTGYNGTSDESGEVSFTLPVGDYRFRADSGGTQFWSGDVNHCTIPGCLDATVVVTVPLTVTVEDTNGQPKEGVPVYAFDGSTYTGFNGTSDASGEVTLTLPEGSYRFRADYNGTQFWSGEANHCAVPGCSGATVVVTLPVTVTVEDTNGVLKEGVPVYVFDGTTYTNFTGTTDINGEVEFTLLQGSYRFRADFNGTEFWSGETNHCDIPGCESASVVVTLPVTVTVEDTDGLPKEGLPVYAFDGSTYTGFNDSTDVNGEVQFTLQQGDYRFRSDLNDTQFWSGDVNHCAIPGCLDATVVVTVPLTVTVEDTNGQPKEGVPVYAFDGTTYTGYNGTTNVDGQVDFTLLQGSYRFRADYNGEQYWSGDENHCDIPGCEAVTIVAGEAPTPTDTPEPTPTDTPEPTNTPEPTPTESASQGGIGVLAMVRPAPIELPLLDPNAVTVMVEDTNGDPKEGLPVYVFDGTAYTGYNDITNASGEVVFDLPEGSYRFRSDLNGTQFWSGETNHCDIPGCSNATVVVTIPVTVTVEDTEGTLKDGLPVYAFDGTTYMGYSGTTDVNGEVVLTLPQGGYRFRSDLNGTHFWSDEINHCTIPGFESATVVVTLPVTVTVTNTDAVPQEGLPVYVFDEATYTGFNGTTDVNGQVSLTLPQGDYRFRSDLNGTQFWSGETNHCTIPGCLSTSITVTIPMIVTVQSQTGSPYPDLPVYVFSGESYTGFNGTSDANGQVVFTLPVGDYRFRSDYDGVQFWSSDVNHCTIPGCLEATVEIPGGVGEVSVTIDYTYDPLYRLTAADYDTGEFFHYNYDAVGNRLTQETHEENNTYVYDIANRLIEVDGVSYTWDNNGNLMSDGVSSYSYDHANRLSSMVQGTDTYAFSYNALGDRLQQIVNGAPTSYTLDINRGLTRVLGDGMNTYLYGVNRVGELQTGGWQFHLGDALGSVRQLTDAGSAVILSQSYSPYGDTLVSEGSGASVYQYTGEMRDLTGLTYLRARYYASVQGRFLTRDEWNGDPDRPSSYNEWLYAYANPVLYVDASGHAAQARPCTKGGFCQLDDVRWGGIVIDGPHFFSSMKIAEGIIGQLDLNIGRDSAPLTVSEINIRFPETKFGIEVSKEGLYEFGRNYLTSLPKGISGPTIRSIGLGIFMNFQLSLETFQAWVDPRCDRRIPGHCSGFSNEDLPSDYLGYIAVAMFGKSSANPNSINDIVGKLGGGHAVESRDPMYKGEYWKVIPGFSLRIFPLRDE